ncbi:glycosyltransferase 87 family protein [Luedemannella flava]|uniref:Glycosyltransferase 87 family protein n=1 Tax=Luedemannella flava TaxID=349316 RepID=A0ABP4YQC9_9ACTN
MWSRARRAATAADQARGGLALDVVLYASSTLFAVYTAVVSALDSHRAWGALAVTGYGLATLVALVQLARYRPTDLTVVRARAWVAGLTWLTTALIPLVIAAHERAAGILGRTQEEVLVIEDGGRRLAATGTPYLGRAAIAALSSGDQLFGYLPYQPAMAGFGLVRAADATSGWWSDARVWFAVATALALGTALYLLRRAGADPGRLVRAAQAATVLPVCALTLATGGDDLPVLGLCLLAFALVAIGRWGLAGLAVGAAAALKLFAWPVGAVLAVLAVTQGRRVIGRFIAGALGLPTLTLLPALYVDPDALVENVLRFPTGHGIVVSPAQSPLPGYLIATALPDGRLVALGLLGGAALAIGIWLVRRPPRSAATAALITGVGLLAALLLLPNTRFGYLLYPVAFLVWAGCLRHRAPARTPPLVPRQTRRTAIRPRPAPSESTG